MAVRRGGGLVAALADGFWITEPDSEDWVRHRPVEADQPDLRFNDGKCDPAGRFLAGSMAYDKHTGRGRALPAGSRTGPWSSSSTA